MNGGDALVATLLAHGVDTGFCVPGESYLAVLEALRRERARFRLLTCRHEAGAAFAAEAYGKLTRGPGIAFVTRGPGATNAAIGVHTAAQDSTPMVLFVGQVGITNIDGENRGSHVVANEQYPLRTEGQADFARFSEGEYARRHAAVRREMAARGLDALIVWGESSGWGELSGARVGMANARYLSNFADQLREYVFFPRDGDPVLFTFSRSHSMCARDISVIPIEYTRADIALSVAERIKERGWQAGRIGLAGATTIFGQSLPADQYERFREELPDAELVVATDLLETVRARKSDEEINWIARATDFTD
ncbi:MAG: aminopeptidase P family N-terminal domain-containing protein, partial [Proteobacteria bacterium]|nr:aminopeptidase P family N-terminal domain-containing protein [Pseudomonadota bacterium]